MCGVGFFGVFGATRINARDAGTLMAGLKRGYGVFSPAFWGLVRVVRPGNPAPGCGSCREGDKSVVRVDRPGG